MNLTLIIQYIYSFELFWNLIKRDFDFFYKGHFCSHLSIISLKIYKNIKIILVVIIYFLASIFIEKITQIDKLII